MITNQGYWLLMVNIEVSDRLKLINHQIKISKLKMTIMYLIKLLEVKFTQIIELRFQIQNDK